MLLQTFIMKGPEMKGQKKLGGRPQLHVGPRHTVALRLPQDEWRKLQQIGMLRGLKPGPYSTRLVVEHLRSVDLTSLQDGITS